MLHISSPLKCAFSYHVAVGVHVQPNHANGVRGACFPTWDCLLKPQTNGSLCSRTVGNGARPVLLEEVHLRRLHGLLQLPCLWTCFQAETEVGDQTYQIGNSITAGFHTKPHGLRANHGAEPLQALEHVGRVRCARASISSNIYISANNISRLQVNGHRALSSKRRETRQIRERGCR